MDEKRPDDLGIVLDCAVAPQFLGARNLRLLLLKEVRQRIAHFGRHARERIRHEIVAARV